MEMTKLPVIYAIHIKMNWQLYVKGESFLRLNVNVFTDVDNRARGRSRDNIGPKRVH